VEEQDLKRFLLLTLGKNVWHSTTEMAHGSTSGCPDLLILTPFSPFPLPVELKLAKLDGDLIFPSRIRPAQIAWHDRLSRAGGRSRFVFGCYRRFGWDVWVLDDCRHETLRGWKDGFPVGTLTLCTAFGSFDHQAWWRGLADVVSVPDQKKHELARGQGKPHVDQEG